MKTDIVNQSSYPQKSLQGAPLKKSDSTKPLAGRPLEMKNPLAETADYKVELSSRTPQLPTLPSVPSVPLPSLDVPDLPTLPKDKIKEEVVKKAVEVKAPEVKAGHLKKPAIFFIKGLDVFFSPSKSEGGYAGLGRIADSVEGSRLYGWDQKEEIMKEIKKVHKDYPVILVGHSLGGDTAIEIADELDSLKQNFRSVDLLVTIDAVGFNHDIIPQNVKKHLNVFGETSLFLNDGPHVARRDEKTEVRNILSPLAHTDIDDDRAIQYEVVTLIQEALSKSPA